MRILLTNDDGIYAPGIAAMFDALVDHPVQGRTRHGGVLIDPSAEHRSSQCEVFPAAGLSHISQIFVVPSDAR